MMGRTHFKVGILSYLIAGSVPLIATMPLIGKGKAEVSIAQACVAGLAALMADVDSQHSQINQMNPVTKTASQFIDSTENILKNILRTAFTIGIGIGILLFRKEFIQLLSTYNKITPYASMITYGSATLFIVLGSLGKKGDRILSNIPIVGYIYNQILSMVNQGGAFLKRFLMFMLYTGIGAWIIYYNYRFIRDPYLYLVGVLFIAAVSFPHRSLFHSAEGLIMFTLAVSYLTRRIGYPEFQHAFFIGYFSHLYLADIFTEEGIPLSILPRILKKIGLHGQMKKFWLYRIAYGIFNIRLRIPIIHTGTTKGNIFEEIYVFILLAAAIISFTTNQVLIKLV
ncbi:metal-dependent hydrolase [Thermotalea metallivorans]|uniref:Inner membrane protein n=1 Tax=Thermotalea metallivorans TaxID=520762 RepID=A0A140L338_9FIRM|nr:metal-dependent hydrolase [Thermotalea metallivorans]KXG74963.1 hypothetical protein AN619_20170 [Thermotalea metallivorans]